jgi:peptide/nickel transport system substrate-binding protein
MPTNATQDLDHYVGARIRERWIMLGRVRALIILLGIASGLVVAPVRAETVVRWASAAGVLSWDPHGADNLPSFNGYRQVYESLVLHDAALNLVPGLATSWRMVDPLTWHFVLRQGVTFHDGTPLTAADVVFSIDRARARTAALADVLPRIVAVRAVDPRTVAITTARPELRLPVQIQLASILSKRWAQQHRVAAATPDDKDASTYARDHANGTGPFMLVAHEPGRRTVLVRNPHWWGASEYPHNIDRIVWTVIPDAEERLWAFLAGEFDFLQDPPLDRLEHIRATPGLKLVQTGLLRVVILGMDQATAELRSSDTRGKNPFHDRRVRQAVYQAIDVEVLRERALGGLAILTGMLVAPGVIGYMEELDRRLPHDLREAKALMVEAGYPKGFAVRLDCPRTRWNGPVLCEAIAEQLGRIGMRVAVDLLPEREWIARIDDRRTDFYLDNEWPVSFDAAEILREYHSRPRRGGSTGYVNPAFDALVEQIEAEISTYARDGLIEEAWRILLDDVPAVPLFRPMIFWAMRESLELPISPLGAAYFREARVKESSAGRSP